MQRLNNVTNLYRRKDGHKIHDSIQRVSNINCVYLMLCIQLQTLMMKSQVTTHNRINHGLIDVAGCMDGQEAHDRHTLI